MRTRVFIVGLDRLDNPTQLAIKDIPCESARLEYNRMKLAGEQLNGLPVVELHTECQPCERYFAKPQEPKPITKKEKSK